MKLHFAAAFLMAFASYGTALQAQEKVPVYKPGKDVSLPELILSDLSKIISHDCEKKGSGTADLTFLVDSAGNVHDVAFTKFIGTELDRLAVILVRTNRFKPALRNGSPVAVGLTEKIKIDGCVVQITDAAGKKSSHLRLSAPPEQKFASWNSAPAEADFSADVSTQTEKIVKGGPVTAPVPLVEPEAAFSQEAHEKHIEGEVFITMIVDSAGLPQNPKIVKSIGYGLDEQALIAVMRYRFKPATKGGKPVPVYMTIAVNFRFT